MLLAELRARGYEAEEIEPGTVGIAVAFDHREVEGQLPAFVEVTPDGVVLSLIVPVPNVSFNRLRTVLPEEPSTDEVDWEYDLDGDQLALCAIGVGATEHDAATVVGELVARVVDTLRELLDAGAVDVTDAAEDDEITEITGSLAALKQDDPRRAIDRCLAAAERARSLGNPTMASMFETAAGELHLELGDVHRAAQLIEPAWEQMDEPVFWADIVGSLAQLRVQQGRSEEGVALLEASLGEQDDPADRATLRAALGLVLAECGRDVEASRLLAAAADDPLLQEYYRAKVQGQLEAMRGRGGASRQLVDPGEGIEDVMDATFARLNALASLGATLDRPTFIAARGHIAELIGLVGLDAHRLGPAQLARLASAKAYVASMDGHEAAARGHFAEARALADEAGDAELVRSLELFERLSFDPLAGDDPSLSPMERMAALVNLAAAEAAALSRRWLDAQRGLVVTGLDEGSQREAVQRAQAAVLQAIELADAERHLYSGVADRASWAGLAGKAYEVGLMLSVVLDDDAEVIEILERARAQGAPIGPDGDDAGDDGGPEGSRLIGLLRESLGDRPVSRPLVASVRSGAAPGDAPVERLDLDDLTAAVAGGPAWWWGCHAFGERVYWAVRSPEGRTWSGSGTLHGRPEPRLIESAFPDASEAERRRIATRFLPTEDAEIQLVDLPHLFRSLVKDDVDPHFLLGDEDGRRDEVLRALARAVLPPPLLAAVRDAARRQEPLRLVWAAPRELARVPIGLLPIDDDPGQATRFLEGAVVVMAPPTSLVAAGEAATPLPSALRPVLLVLGRGADLGTLDDLIRRVAPTPTSVLSGATRHVIKQMAAAIARPETVLQAWRANREAVGVYYGHVVHDEGSSSGSAALLLTDGTHEDRLPASRLLAPEREGAPHTVVLAGCASLSAADAGTGEWWGLATGLLWQGSSHVVGSAWTVRTVPATEDFVAELTRELRVTDDPAMALHRLQLDRCRAWQASGGTASAGVAPPYDWAGWSIVTTGTAR